MKKIAVIILILLYLLFLFKCVKFEFKTYDNMTVEERLWTEQSIIPGW